MKKQWHKYRRTEVVLATEYQDDDLSDVFVNPDYFPLKRGDMLIKLGEVTIGLPRHIFDKRWTRLNQEVILRGSGGNVA
jgi:hypothetical protein